MTAAQINVKRVYDSPSKADGTRILVDRLWPRGLTKEYAHVDLWLRDVSPSNELRKWFHANPERWAEFRKRYFEELQAETASDAVQRLRQIARGNKAVTLLFASKNLEHSNATVLKEFISEGKRTADELRD